MKIFANIPTVVADADYLNGKLEDGTTDINEAINQDVIQFLQKLLQDASIVQNDLPDNELNGYQTIEALEIVVRTYTATESEQGVLEIATAAEAQDGSADNKILTPLKLQSVTSTEARKGIVEKATAAEAQAGTAEKNITADLLQGIVDGIKFKKVPIGNWDMQTDPGKSVPHGLTDHTKFIGAKVSIFADGSTTLGYNLEGVITSGAIQGGYDSWDATNLFLRRVTGGVFDSTSYNDNVQNRGEVVIFYFE